MNLIRDRLTALTARYAVLAWIPLLLTVVDRRTQALRAAGRDRGASAVEWAVIAAIGVAAAGLIGTAIYNKVSNKTDCVSGDGCAPPGAGK